MTATSTARYGILYLDGKKVENAYVLSVKQRANSCSGNTASFVLEKPGSRGFAKLKDLELARETENKICQVKVQLWGETWPESIIHYGRVVASQNVLDGDIRIFTSRLDPHLFGPARIDHEEQLYPADKFGRSNMAATDDEAVFNPVVDGRAIPNMWNSLTSVGFPPKDSKTDKEEDEPRRRTSQYPVFIRPVSLPLSALAPIDPVPKIRELEFWSPADAACYLMWRMNPAEKYVRNMTLAELKTAIGEDRNVLRGFKIPAEATLESLLTKLLQPLGFKWRVDVGLTKPKVEVFPAEGLAGTYFQRQKPGEELNRYGPDTVRDGSQVRSANIRVDHVDASANDIIVLGDWYYFESTFELMPAWKADYDNMTADQLTESAMADSGNRALLRVWREWVLNEGGDYIGVRTPGADAYGDQAANPYDFSKVFGFTAKPIRRKFLPTITQGNELINNPWGSWKGIYVEYWSDVENTWLHVSHLGDGSTVRPLDDECGIRFTNPSSPPARLISEGIYGVKIRVTATVRSDARLFGRSSATARETYLKDLLPRIVEAKEYKVNRVDKQSIFYDSVQTGALKSVERDDGDAIAAYARTLYKHWNRSHIDGQVTVEGIDSIADWFLHHWESIEPAGIRLKSTATALAKDRKYVNIVGVSWDFETQQTEYDVSTVPRRIE